MTKTFLIRYCEEEVEINDVVLFRAEIDVEPEYLNTDFYLDCDLYFCDLSSLGGPTGWKHNYKNYESKAVFKNVQTQSFKIKNLVTGAAEFLPINFKGNFFSAMNVQVQSGMLDYKFR
jgi:hypothetical protein